jgi:uncharacterized protein (DUF433 family)
MATNQTTLHAIDHIVSTPGICGGKPRIDGHRITVQNIAIWHEQLSQSPEEIAADYELTLAQIHAALAYYYDHREEIDRQIKEDDEFVEKMMAEQQGPNPLTERLNRLGLTLEQAHALIDYTHDHREEVDQAVTAAGLDDWAVPPIEKWVKIGLVEKVSKSS